MARQFVAIGFSEQEFDLPILVIRFAAVILSSIH
jgi:hypothetical protein